MKRIDVRVYVLEIAFLLSGRILENIRNSEQQIVDVFQ